MPNNSITDTVTVAADYAPLSASSLVMTVDISCPPGNVGNVTFRDAAGNEAEWVPGEWHNFQSVDLAELQIKGTAGDKVTIVGGTW